MPDNFVISSRIFAEYAGKNINVWQEAIGCLVTHFRFGPGVIDSVRLIEYPLNIAIRVQFSDRWKVFLVEHLSEFQDMQISKDVKSSDEIYRFSIERRMVEELRQREEYQKVVAEENRLQALQEERARHEAEKQMLLGKLRDQFKQKFLAVSEYYQSQCSVYISHQEYETEKAAYVQSWIQNHLNSNPDLEQVAAIAATESHIQVVARAGSGKTSTLINRSQFLLQHCGVATNEMLLLAFNRKAAEEIRERFAGNSRGGIPHVMTFHALAYALVHPEEGILFDEPDGEQSKSRAIQSVIDDYLQTQDGHDNIRALMMAHFREDWVRIASSGYDKPRAEILKYRRSLLREGVGGTYLKSFGEKIIDDFLFEHNLNYKYERNFWWKGINYRPDFTIFTGQNKGVVIEYFGLQGDPDYDALSDRKRHYWQDNNDWQFLEFSPDYWRDKGADAFRRLLQRSLEEQGITCRRLSEEEIWNKVKDRAIDRFTKVVVSFIQRCRKLCLTSEQLAAIVLRHRPANNVEQDFLGLVQSFYSSYLERIRETGEDDFDGLMQQAAGIVASGQTVFRRKSGNGNLQQLRYILIDEFQDFSELFHRLITAIRGQNAQAQFFCVGDDWQAINGFTGSDLHFYRDFGQLFYPSRQFYVATNYRSSTSIVDVGNALMNGLGPPARAKKTTAGQVMVADLGAFEPTPKEREIHSGDNLTPAVLRLINKSIADGEDVVLLSRKNSLPGYGYSGDRKKSSPSSELDVFLRMIRAHLPESERQRVTISTAHKYKGLQKHTVIVLDAVARCYPLIHPDLIFMRILGDTLERIIAEERRLFYVSLTRAEERLFIVTEKDNVSPFLEELQRNRIISRLEWSDFQPIAGPIKRITVRVGNQNGRSGKPTYGIKDMLKAGGYRWTGSGWQAWYRTWPSDGFSMEHFIDEAIWAPQADGIEVRLYDDVDNMIATYRIDHGQWTCIVALSLDAEVRK